MSKIEIRSLVKRFGQNEVIPPLDLTIPDKALTVLLGPSGCGKSTLLRLIAGLELPDSGTILLDGNDITFTEPRTRDMAMVFQNYALYPHLTIRDNLAFPLKVATIDKATIATKVAETAELLGLTPLLDRYPRTLSGGERQRTAVGRAIIRNPRLFLFDEPLSNLDFQLRNQMRGELRSIQQRLGKTAIYVTHDQTEAMTMADMLVVLNKGRIMQIGTPTEVYQRPANLFVAKFIGSPPMNIIDSVIESGTAYTKNPRLAITKLDIRDGSYQLGIRPDQLTADVDGEGPRIIVDRFEFHGSSSYVFGELAGQAIMARAQEDRSLRSGQIVSLSLDQKDIHAFDASIGDRVKA